MKFCNYWVTKRVEHYTEGSVTAGPDDPVEAGASTMYYARSKWNGPVIFEDHDLENLLRTLEEVETIVAKEQKSGSH